MKYTSIFALTLLAAASAVAQPYNISWVASTGSNTATCGTRAAPCLNFQTAHDHTNTGGIIKAVDADNYGMVIVTKAITIDGNGVGAEIEVGGTGTGIRVNAGVAVTIRDLTIHVVLNGDGIDAYGDTHIENVVIAGAPAYGVFLDGGRLTAKNLTVTGAGLIGISINGGLASTSASIRDSVVRSFFGGDGIYVQANGFATAVLIERSELSFNSTGLVADNFGGGGATVRMSDSVITGNNTGVSTINGGQIISFRTNMLAGNTTDGAIPFSISLK